MLETLSWLLERRCVLWKQIGYFFSYGVGDSENDDSPFIYYIKFAQPLLLYYRIWRIILHTILEHMTSIAQQHKDIIGGFILLPTALYPNKKKHEKQWNIIGFSSPNKTRYTKKQLFLLLLIKDLLLTDSVYIQLVLWTDGNKTFVLAF